MRRNIGRKIQPFLYLLPSIVILIFIYLYSFISLLKDSFYNISTKTAVFVGLRNYINVFGDSLFWDSLLHNLIIIVVSLPVLIIFSILFAVFLYERIKGWKAYRVIVFLPYIFAITVIGIAFSYIFTYRGVLNYILNLLHLNFLALDWLGSPRVAIFTLIFVIIWKELGFGVILLYSRMMSIPEEIYDAAKVDGVSWWQNLRYITIPQLRTIIEFYAVIIVITMLSWIFNYVYVMTSGGPGNSTNVAEYYIYRRAFQYNQMNVANTASVILFIVTLILVFIRFKLERREEEIID